MDAEDFLFAFIFFFFFKTPGSVVDGSSFCHTNTDAANLLVSRYRSCVDEKRSGMVMSTLRRRSEPTPGLLPERASSSDGG